MEYIDYSELCSNYRNPSDITYSELLRTNEWKLKRDEIQRRENHKCQECHSETVGFWIPKAFGDAGVYEVPAVLDLVEVSVDYVCPYSGEVLYEYPSMVEMLVEDKDPRFSQVHHTFYVYGQLPWEYENEHLMHLCDRCHKKLHSEIEIFVYASMEKRVNGQPITRCGKCGGTGYLSQYNYYQDGICFDCDGRGHV